MPTSNSNISATFSGNNVVLSGLGKARITLKLTWRDDPDAYGDAIDDVKFYGISMDSPGSDGTSTGLSTSLHRGTYPMDLTGVINGVGNPHSLSPTELGFRDRDGSDNNARLLITGVTNETYTAAVANLYLNGVASDVVITTGQSVGVGWGTEGCGGDNDFVWVKENGTQISTITSGGLTRYPSSGTTTYKLRAYNFLGDETITKTLNVTAYDPPSGTISINNTSPLQNVDSVTVSWTSSGNGGGVQLIGSFAGGTAPTSVGNNDDHTFTPTTAGVNYKLKLKVTNGAGESYTTPNVTYQVRDETPSGINFDDSTDNTPLNRTNRESETITVKDFGPTQYTDNKLPIKSNYPIQVQINGDGVWRDVEQI